MAAGVALMTACVIAAPVFADSVTTSRRHHGQVTLPGWPPVANRSAGTCSGGTMMAGTYSGFTVTGECFIAFGAVVQINGDLTIADGASLDDHGAESWLHAQMHVAGNVSVGKGAVLGMGWNSPDGEGSLGPDTVGGNIVANQPLALQLGQITVGGSVISLGGGVLSASGADFRNFPIKDNVIHGSLMIDGWRGGWLGVIRNHVDGNVIVVNNVSVSTESGPGTDPDSTEVMGSALGPISIPQTIGGNLICHDNVPAAQVNPADGGAKNFVGGEAFGECVGLTQ
jgi:hypothetical protein